MSSPLAELNAYIRGATAHKPEGELASVGRFRQAWETVRTLDRLEEAVARAPANAGPLNSHALVLRSLAMMGELSTDYLRRFMAHAEALHWLEKAREQYPREPAKAKGARTAKRKK